MCRPQKRTKLNTSTKLSNYKAMAEFKTKKEKFDILLGLIAKTDNEELQGAFLDYQNEKNENNEGYLNYLENMCKQGSSIETKAALPLQNVRCFKTYDEKIIKELGFELDHKYDHDQFHTNRYRKGLLMVEFTYEEKTLKIVDLTIDETFCKPITYAELQALSLILGEIPE